jgi:hypothetical protein
MVIPSRLPEYIVFYLLLPELLLGAERPQFLQLLEMSQARLRYQRSWQSDSVQFSKDQISHTLQFNGVAACTSCT